MNFILLNKLKILLKNKWHNDIYLPKAIINKMEKLLTDDLHNFPEKYLQKFINLIKSYNLIFPETYIKSYVNFKNFSLLSSSYLYLYDNNFIISDDKIFSIPKNIKISIIDPLKDTKLFFSVLLNESNIITNINELQLLNTMLMNKLVIIEIDENQEIKDILEINSLIINIKKIFYFFSVHIIFKIKKNSCLKVLHRYESINNIENKKLLNAINSEIIEINLAENSSIEYTTIQNLNECTYNLSNIIIRQDKNSNYKLNNISSDGNYRYNKLEVHQYGSNSLSNVNWLNIGVKGQHLYDDIKIIHNCSNGISKQNFRGIYKEDVTSWIKSFIKINDKLNNIVTDQTSKSLLLSNKSYVKVEPFMEINSKDIKCDHAVAIEQVDENSLFYLQSRGISLINAKKLITFNFIENLIHEISIVNIKVFVTKFLKEKINKIFIF